MIDSGVSSPLHMRKTLERLVIEDAFPVSSRARAEEAVAQ